MGFEIFYFIALIPTIVGMLLFFYNKEYVLEEWAINTGIAFLVAGICHFVMLRGMTYDKETWSGQIVSVEHVPSWVQSYEVAVYKTEIHTTTDSEGRTTTETREVFSHYETRYRTIPEQYNAYTNIDYNFSIDLNQYREIGQKFGGNMIVLGGDRPSYHSGDLNNYIFNNETNVIVPVIKAVSFENRVAVSPSVFSYRKLSKEESDRLPEYPYVTNPRVSNRVIGNVNIGVEEWDILNAILGGPKKINLIIVRLDSLSDAQLLEAKWIGGKKNDLVLTFGDGWSYVFGWTESNLVKRNLESILIENPVDSSIIPKIKEEVWQNFKPVDWSKFDYLDIQPRFIHIIWYLIFVLVAQAITILIMLNNNYGKNHAKSNYSSYYRRRRFRI